MSIYYVKGTMLLFLPFLFIHKQILSFLCKFSLHLVIHPHAFLLSSMAHPIHRKFIIIRGLLWFFFLCIFSTATIDRLESKIHFFYLSQIVNIQKLVTKGKGEEPIHDLKQRREQMLSDAPF